MRNIIFIATLIVLPVLLLAEESDTTKNYNLNPVTITATRTETPRNLVVPSISIISQEELKANPEKSIFSLISQEIPGVFVQERDVLGFGVSNPAGQLTIRGVGGSPTTEVLTLIDGRPQYMGLMGHPVNDSYLSANVERVEVIRGPASVLYGSNAMGGVINIITHKAMEPGLSGNASLTYGTDDAQQDGVHLAYQENNWNVLGSFTHEHTDGSRPWSEYTANSGYVKSSVTLSDQYTATLDGSYTKFHTYDPGTVASPYINDWMNIERGYAGISLENDWGISKGALRYIYTFGHNELDPVYNSSWVSNDYISAVTLYQSLPLLPSHTLTVGIDASQNGGKGQNNTSNGTVNTYGGEHSVYEYGVYVDMQSIFYNKLMFNYGLRYDRNELFGDVTTPQFGITYTINEATSVRASASHGFRNPTISELYLFAPTPSLKPEEMWNYEIGISHMYNNWFSADITGFISEGSNMITMIAYQPNGRINSGGFVNRGVEFSGQAFITDDFHINTSYSYTDVANPAISVPRHKIFIGGDYHYSIFAVYVTAQHVEGLYSLAQIHYANVRVSLPNYTNVGVKLAVHVLEKISISVGSQNLLDESYQTIYGYPMPGRTYSIGVQAGI
jgi:outer membrane cobalamin receptor